MVLRYLFSYEIFIFLFNEPYVPQIFFLFIHNNDSSYGIETNQYYICQLISIFYMCICTNNGVNYFSLGGLGGHYSAVTSI